MDDIATCFISQDITTDMANRGMFGHHKMVEERGVLSCEFQRTKPNNVFIGSRRGVKLYDCHTRKFLHSFVETENGITSIKYVEARNWIMFITGSHLTRTRHISVYDCETKEKVRDVDTGLYNAQSFAISPAKSRTLVGGQDEKGDPQVKTLTWNDWQLMNTNIELTSLPLSIAISDDDSDVIAFGCIVNDIEVWRHDNGGMALAKLAGHTKGVEAVTFCGAIDEPWLLSGGLDKEVKLWDYQKQVCLYTLKGKAIAEVNAIVYYAKFRSAFSAHADGRVMWWNIDSRKLGLSFGFATEYDNGSALAITENGKGEVAVGCDVGIVVHKFGTKHGPRQCSFRMVEELSFPGQGVIILHKANARSTNATSLKPLLAKTITAETHAGANGLKRAFQLHLSTSRVAIQSLHGDDVTVLAESYLPDDTLEDDPACSYWLSLDKKRGILRYGKGETRKETVLVERKLYDQLLLDTLKQVSEVTVVGEGKRNTILYRNNRIELSGAVLKMSKPYMRAGGGGGGRALGGLIH